MMINLVSSAELTQLRDLKSLEVPELSGSQELLLATILYLRQLKAKEPKQLWFFLSSIQTEEGAKQVGYNSNAPELPEDRIVWNTGEVMESPGIKDQFRFAYVHGAGNTLWLAHTIASCTHSKFPLAKRWMEWALATAVVMLTDAGVDWIPEERRQEEFKQTIGGLEVADFLDL